jgi:hypothetical protein
MPVRFKEFEFHIKLVTVLLALLCWSTIQNVLVPGCPRFVELVCLCVFVLSLAISFVNPVTWVQFPVLLRTCWLSVGLIRVNVNCPPGLGGAAGFTSKFFAQEYRALDADNRINKPFSCLHTLLTVLLVL